MNTTTVSFIIAKEEERGFEVVVPFLGKVKLDDKVFKVEDSQVETLLLTGLFELVFSGVPEKLLDLAKEEIKGLEREFLEDFFLDCVKKDSSLLLSSLPKTAESLSNLYKDLEEETPPLIPIETPSLGPLPDLYKELEKDFVKTEPEGEEGSVKTEPEGEAPSTPLGEVKTEEAKAGQEVGFEEISEKLKVLSKVELIEFAMGLNGDSPLFEESKLNYLTKAQITNQILEALKNK